MGRLILIRHGESLGNRDRVFAANTDALALTELGYRQAAHAAERLRIGFQVARVVSSAYVRARETARVIATALGTPHTIDPELHERLIGALAGHSYDAARQAPGYEPLRPWLWKPEGGESFVEVRARVAPVLDRLAREHPDEDVAVVSHGGVMMALWAYLTDRWEGAHVPDNCGVVVVEHGPRGYGPPRVLDDAAATPDAGG